MILFYGSVIVVNQQTLDLDPFILICGPTIQVTLRHFVSISS